MFLAPVKSNKKHKDILSFKADKLKLFREKMTPYKKDIEYGSLLKFYGYKMKGAYTNIVIDFMYHTEIMMPDAVMPVRLHECRDNYKGEEKILEIKLPHFKVLCTEILQVNLWKRDIL